MTIFREKHIKKSRQDRICHWCCEMIDVGSSYVSYGWRDGDDGGYCHMHPECFKASGQMSQEDPGFVFSIGDFNRGCCCANGDCKCERVISN